MLSREQGLPWEPWLEGSCLHTEARNQACSEFALYEPCFQQPSINCHLPLPSPPSWPYDFTGLFIFRSSCQDDFSPYRLPTKGKPYRWRLSQKTQKVCLAVSTPSPPPPLTAPSLKPPPGLPLPVERQHLSSRGVVCSTSFLCFQSPPVPPPKFPRMHFLGTTPPSSLLL